jgi:hypothetical protein
LLGLQTTHVADTVEARSSLLVEGRKTISEILIECRV